MAPDDDRSAIADVLDVLRTAAGRGVEVAGTGAEVLGAGVDDAVRALVERRVQRALRPTAPAVTATDLVLALSTPGGGGAVASRLGRTSAQLASRSRRVRAVGGRTPVGLALRYGPGLLDALTASVRGLDAAAAHLVTRARERRIEPDPDRLRAVVVQAIVGAPLDPDADIDHTHLARLWLSDAGRRLAPFGLHRVRALARGRTPEAIAASLAAVDVRRLEA